VLWKDELALDLSLGLKSQLNLKSSICPPAGRYTAPRKKCREHIWLWGAAG